MEDSSVSGRNSLNYGSAHRRDYYIRMAHLYSNVLYMTGDDGKTEGIYGVTSSVGIVE